MRLFSRHKKGAPRKNKVEEIQLFTSLGDMWLHNWDELNKSNNLKWVIKNDADRDAFVPYHKLDTAFIILMDDWFKLTDAKSNRKELNVLMIKRIEKANLVMIGDKFQMNWVRKYDQMIKDLVGDNTGYDPDKQRMALSASLKMFIDKKTITVRDYYKLIEVVAENNESNTIEDGE